MKTPHLLPAGVACSLVLLGLLGFSFYMQWTEDRYIHAIAPLWWQQKGLGSVLQRTAFRQPDLLPIYGSSDLLIGGATAGRAVFQHYPTGFTLFPVGWTQIGPLNMALELAAAGSSVQGKKLIISLSTQYLTNGAPNYAGDFSDLTANEAAFSPHLSLSLKQRLAQRMLQYPSTLKSDPLLAFALQQLAQETLLGHVLYSTVWPLGWLHLWVLHLQDHWAVLIYLRQHHLTPTVQHQPQALNWHAIMAAFAKQAKADADNNSFGFSNGNWRLRRSNLLHEKGTLSDRTLRTQIAHAPGWTDLDLLLSEVQELNAHALILTVPFKGNFLDYRGNSPATRALYYAKIHELAQQHGMQAVTFEQFEYDKYFVYDASDHLSKEGWAYYDQTIDNFYHNRLP